MKWALIILLLFMQGDPKKKEKPRPFKEVKREIIKNAQQEKLDKTMDSVTLKLDSILRILNDTTKIKEDEI